MPGYPEALNLSAFPLHVFRYSLMIAFQGDEGIVYAVARQHRKPGYWSGRLK